MVCQGMGLLDDAIREHLELKRLRGADPGRVAHEEHEAFGPVHGGESAGADGGAGVSDDLAGEMADESKPGASALDDDHAHAAGADTVRADDVEGFSSVAQETAELDMRAVLGEESAHDDAAVRTAAAGPAQDGLSTEDAPTEQGDDPLEWEMPER